MDLFTSTPGAPSPLAFRMRPRTLDEFVGQEHIVGKGRLLRRVIQADQVSSLIFYGPPGTGKTTLAQVIANSTRSHFITMNAVLAGVKELREAIEVAKNNRDLYGRRTTLFVDEVHRWNKAQQDALLPWVENGTVILIGATTENPYFEVNRALVSRSRIFQLKPLTEEDLRAVARAAIADPERGYGQWKVAFTEEALDHLVKIANGDARSLLNAIELAVETTPARFPPPDGEEIAITREIAEESIQRKVVLYDKEGDYHFDTISAFIKSVRGSDPDAALYWLARMVLAGEDPHYIFRRMLILASEDVGMADPQALVFVESAAAAFDRVGMPEGRFHLAHATLYLATAAKSNSSMGFFDALALLESEHREGETPNHLRDASRDKEGFGHGEGYMYPHAFKDHWVAQQYLPASLQGKVFYSPSDQGREAAIREEVLRRREIQIATALEPPSTEVLTFTSAGTSSARWIERLSAGRRTALTSIRDRIFSALPVQRHSRILDADARTGILLWEALRRAPEGGVWGVVASQEDAALLQHRMKELEQAVRPVILQPDRPLAEMARALSSLEPEQVMTALGVDPAIRFDFVVGRDLFTRMPASDRAGLTRLLLALLAPGGVLSFAQVIPRLGQRLSSLVSMENLALSKRLEAAEEEAYSDPSNDLVNWSHEDLAAACRAAGAREVNVETERSIESRRITDREMDLWLAPDSSYGRALAGGLAAHELARVDEAFRAQLIGREVAWTSTVASVVARR
ncbi:MAG: AAA family ATPase [Spirochaetia bacterium]|jgi:putative ATPase